MVWLGAHFSHRKQCEWNVKIRMLLISPTLQEMGQPLHGGETTWKQRVDGRWTDSFGSSNLIFRGEWIGFFGQKWWKYSKLMSHEIGFPSMSKKRCLFYPFFPWISLNKCRSRMPRQQMVHSPCWWLAAPQLQGFQMTTVWICTEREPNCEP